MTSSRPVLGTANQKRWPRWLRLGLPLLLGPWLLLELVFPWRFGWGDVRLVDRGPLRSVRFAVDLGDVVLRTGERRTWQLPGVPGRGLALDLAPLFRALAAHDDARVVLSMQGAAGSRSCTVRGRRELLLGSSEPGLAEVTTWPRSVAPIVFELRVEVGVPGDIAVPLRGEEPAR